jgi:hypothetical protein
MKSLGAVSIATIVALSSARPADALPEGGVFALQMRMSGTKGGTITESVKVVRMGPDEYRLLTPSDDGVTFHAFVRDGSFTATSEGSGAQLSFTGRLDGAGFVNPGTLTIVRGGKAVARGSVQLTQVSARSTCSPDDLLAGFTASVGACNLPPFPAAPVPSAVGIENIARRSFRFKLKNWCAMAGVNKICQIANPIVVLQEEWQDGVDVTDVAAVDAGITAAQGNLQSVVGTAAAP